MVHELPIVSTNAGGIPEVIENNQQGLLVSPCEPQELQESIRWALTHHDKMREMATNAKQRIQEFSTEKMVADYQEAFDELVKNSKRG